MSVFVCVCACSNQRVDHTQLKCIFAWRCIPKEFNCFCSNFNWILNAMQCKIHLSELLRIVIASHSPVHNFFLTSFSECLPTSNSISMLSVSQCISKGLHFEMHTNPVLFSSGNGIRSEWHGVRYTCISHLDDTLNTHRLCEWNCSLIFFLVYLHNILYSKCSVYQTIETMLNSKMG